MKKIVLALLLVTGATNCWGMKFFSKLFNVSSRCGDDKDELDYRKYCNQDQREGRRSSQDAGGNASKMTVKKQPSKCSKDQNESQNPGQKRMLDGTHHTRKSKSPTPPTTGKGPSNIFHTLAKYATNADDFYKMLNHDSKFEAIPSNERTHLTMIYNAVEAITTDSKEQLPLRNSEYQLDKNTIAAMYEQIVQSLLLDPSQSIKNKTHIGKLFAQNEQGQTPLQVATESNNPNIKQQLETFTKLGNAEGVMKYFVPKGLGKKKKVKKKKKKKK